MNFYIAIKLILILLLLVLISLRLVDLIFAENIVFIILINSRLL